MVDMVKKLHKKNADLLHPGEQVLGAAVVSKVGQFKKNVAFGAIGGLVGAAVGNAIGGKSESAEADTMAESFPEIRQAILALTDQRWILFEQSLMSGAAKSVLTEWPLDAISGLSMEKAKLNHRIDVVFADGSIAQVESVKAAKPGALVEAAAAR